MPNAITHYLCAISISTQINKNSYIYDCLKEYPSYFALGSSGGDIFFYRHSLPWSLNFDKKNVAYFGSMLHGNKINQFFKAALDIIKNSSEELRKPLVSYFAGYLTHYALDRNAHPFIFYQSGVGKKYTYDHRYYESCLDTLMLKRIRNQDVSQFPGYSIIDLKKIDPEVLFYFYGKIAQDVYCFDLNLKDLKESLKEMNQALHLVHDKSGLKIKFFSWIEKVFVKKNIFTCSMVPKNIKDEIDYLNLRHKVWHDPCTKEIRVKSFIDIYEESVAEGGIFLKELEAILSKNCSFKILLNMIDDRCFDTNLKESYELKYHNCVFERR